MGDVRSNHQAHVDASLARNKEMAFKKDSTDLSNSFNKIDSISSNKNIMSKDKSSKSKPYKQKIDGILNKRKGDVDFNMRMMGF